MVGTSYEPREVTASINIQPRRVLLPCRINRMMTLHEARSIVSLSKVALSRSSHAILDHYREDSDRLLGVFAGRSWLHINRSQPRGARGKHSRCHRVSH